MKKIEKYNDTIFESIKHIDESGNEYWEARELMKVLDYKEWRKFNNLIKKAKTACETSKINSIDHFVGADKMITIAKGGKRHVEDYKLSRYACYLIMQNADPKKRALTKSN